MKDKKGISQLMTIIVFIIPILVVAGIILWNLAKGGAFLGGTTTELELKATSRSCLAQPGIDARAPFDADFGTAGGDGYPDTCDLCLGGDDSLDADGDGIPDACDNDPNNPPEKRKYTMVKICEGNEFGYKNRYGGAYWDTRKEQCVLNCYHELGVGGTKNKNYPCPPVSA